MYSIHFGKGGRPNNSGLKYSIESRTSVAFVVNSRSNRRSGIITHCIPALRADKTPFGESSKARQHPGAKMKAYSKFLKCHYESFVSFYVIVPHTFFANIARNFLPCAPNDISDNRTPH